MNDITIFILVYLAIGTCVCQLAAYLSAKAWHKTYREEMKAAWTLYIFTIPFWILGLDILFDNSAARRCVNEREIARLEMEQRHGRNYD